MTKKRYFTAPIVLTKLYQCLVHLSQLLFAGKLMQLVEKDM